MLKPPLGELYGMLKPPLGELEALTGLLGVVWLAGLVPLGNEYGKLE